jgi:hypothetical protein
VLQFNAVVVYRNIFQDNRESHFLQKSSTKRCVIGIANCAVVYKIAICIGITRIFAHTIAHFNLQ